MRMRLAQLAGSVYAVGPTSWECVKQDNLKRKLLKIVMTMNETNEIFVEIIFPTYIVCM